MIRLEFTKQGFVAALALALYACGAGDGGESTEQPQDAAAADSVSSALGTCTPSYSRSCDPWSSPACIEHHSSGRCTKWFIIRTCYVYTQNYDCTSSTRLEFETKTW